MIRNTLLGPILGLFSGIAAAQASPLEAAADGVLALHPSSHFLVIGETHGTKETPALVGVLAERLAAKGDLVVALEIDMDMQPQVDAWMASEGGEEALAALVSMPFWDVPTDRNDGRRSEAKRDLLVRLRALRAQHPSLHVALIDTRVPGEDLRTARERGMAQAVRTLRAERPEATLLVLVGNYHAMRRVSEASLAGGLISPPPPMLSTLQDLDPVAVVVSARTGTYWACINTACGVKQVRGGREAGDGVVVEALPATDGYDARVEFPSFEAAMPVPRPTAR